MKHPKPSILPKNLMPDEKKSKEISEEDYEPMTYICFHEPSDLSLEPQTSIGRLGKKIGRFLKRIKKPS